MMQVGIGRIVISQELTTGTSLLTTLTQSATTLYGILPTPIV